MKQLNGVNSWVAEYLQSRVGGVDEFIDCLVSMIFNSSQLEVKSDFPIHVLDDLEWGKGGGRGRNIQNVSVLLQEYLGRGMYVLMFDLMGDMYSDGYNSDIVIERQNCQIHVLHGPEAQFVDISKMISALESYASLTVVTRTLDSLEESIMSQDTIDIVFCAVGAFDGDGYIRVSFE